MNVQQLIRDFKERADSAGKPITIENRSKYIVVRCGGRQALLPHTRRQLQHPQHFYKALSL